MMPSRGWRMAHRRSVGKSRLERRPPREGRLSLERLLVVSPGQYVLRPAHAVELASGDSTMGDTKKERKRVRTPKASKACAE